MIIHEILPFTFESLGDFAMDESEKFTFISDNRLPGFKIGPPFDVCLVHLVSEVVQVIRRRTRGMNDFVILNKSEGFFYW